MVGSQDRGRPMGELKARHAEAMKRTRGAQPGAADVEALTRGLSTGREVLERCWPDYREFKARQERQSVRSATSRALR